MRSLPMPVKPHMTWVPSAKRWAKNYRGKSYSVSCRQLGVPPTKEASWQAANEWWEGKLAELGETSRPPVHPLEDLVYRLLKAGAAGGLLDQAERGRAAEDLVTFLEAQAGERLDEPSKILAAAQS